MKLSLIICLQLKATMPSPTTSHKPLHCPQSFTQREMFSLLPSMQPTHGHLENVRNCADGIPEIIPDETKYDVLIAEKNSKKY